MTSGQVVLVTAAAGGTGQFAVQVSWDHFDIITITTNLQFFSM
jgi:NADPH:quinone reductase-like Zn-dependent oxidoreductase